MNFEEVATQLSVFGLVEYLGYNGDNIDTVLVVLSEFSPTFSNLAGMNMVIHNQISPTHPNMSNINISEGVVKIELSK